MSNSPEITTSRTIPVLSVSPIAEDHCVLQSLLRHIQGAKGSESMTFALHACTTLNAALVALPKHQFEIVVCERDLQPGSWKDVLEETVFLPDPPPLLVTSRLADEYLWAEALNLGAYDVLAKPFERMEAMRVLGAAWRAFGSSRRMPARQERHTYKVAAAGA